MGELTKNTPKPLLPANGRPFIEYIVDRLPDEIDEVIFIIGHLGEQIQSHFGGLYKGRKIKYVWQKELKGTGPAVWLAKDLIKGKFLVQYGDDLYPKADLEKLVKNDWAMLVLKQEHLIRGGKVVTNDKGELGDIVESNDHKGEPGILNAGVYVLGPEIFDYELAKVQDKDEYGLPQTLVIAAKDFPVKIVEATSRIAITEPSDIQIAEKNLSASL